MCINGLKIQLLIMSEHLALVSFLPVLGASSCLGMISVLALYQQPRCDGEMPRTAIKMARLESFGFSWEREIAGVKQHRKKIGLLK